MAGVTDHLPYGLSMPHELAAERGENYPINHAIIATDTTAGIATESAAVTTNNPHWSTGRAPWYSSTDGKPNKPLVIGVTGGTASGKTTVVDEIVRQLGLPWVVMLSMDRFYKSLDSNQLKSAHSYNFDHPDAFDFDQFRDTIKELQTGKSVSVPKYSFVTHQRLTETDTIYGADVIIVEGILSLYSADVRGLLDLKIYVDTDDDVRLARRIKRDIRDRGRTVTDVLNQYLTTVKPAHDNYIAPTKRFADIIIPRGGDNYVAIELLVEHVRRQLQKRAENITKQLKADNNNNNNNNSNNNNKSTSTVSSTPAAAVTSAAAISAKSVDYNLPSTITVVPISNNLISINTILFNQLTPPSEFRFQYERLNRLLFQSVFNLITTSNSTIITPTAAEFNGCSAYNSNSLTAISIVRSGETMESTLLQLIPDISIGKIVISQSSNRSEGPRLFYWKFPQSILNNTNHTVLLLDSSLNTGNAIKMAIRVLLDHSVKESNIIVCCNYSSIIGLLSINSLFPAVRIVTTNIQADINNIIGSIADRYFGTVSGQSNNKAEIEQS